MKKFLIFLVVIVVGVSLGLTTYYFMRDDETISINTKEIYCNVGDVVNLEDLDIVINRPYSYRNTTFNYNAGGPLVQSMINFDEEKGYYTALNGGETTLVITTTNERCPEFKISVHIGNGTEEYPYYIENQADLEKIGDSFTLDSHYLLLRDISLSQSFQPIGYNYSTDTWVGFSGSFNGNNHTISGLNLTSTDYANAGLFYSLNNANVTNLYLNNATISGSYDYAGALTGLANNSVISNVFVNSANITNLKDSSVTGGVIGALTGSTSKLSTSLTENVSITLGNANAGTINVTAGGLVGTLDIGTIQATSANSTITSANATGDIAGFVGKFTIDTNLGAIYESLSNSALVGTDNASFISTIEKATNYNANIDQPLYHLAGNIVATNGVVAIRNDADLCDKYFDEINSLYLVREFASMQDAVATLAPADYVFYAVSQSSKVLWDSSAWTLAPGAIPELNMTSSSLSSLSSQYLLKDLTEDNVGDIDDTPVNNGQAFIDFINVNAVNGVITGMKISLQTDIDLTNLNYTPVALVNSVFNGNGHTITGLKLMSGGNGSDAGLFTYLDNSTVTNVTLDEVTTTINATNVGAVAGRMFSTTANSSSEISNIVVNFSNEIVEDINNFGGIVGTMDNNSIVRDVEVNNLTVSSSATLVNVGGLVGVNNSGIIENSTVNNSTIYGISRVGGVVGQNADRVNNITGNVIVNLSSNVGNARIGGAVGLNDGTIENVNLEIDVNVQSTTATNYIGGIAGTNNNTILNTTITGEGISIANGVTADRLYVGGAAAENNARISGVKVYVDTIGSLINGKDHFVGGLVALNSNTDSEITSSIVTSDIYGNNVAGIVVQMGDFDFANNNVTAANCGAVVDQVYVGRYNDLTKELSRNTISGDKYVAGAAYILTGDISNVQLNSNLVGANNNTVTSLIVLIFPDGASFKYATVNSTLDGYGKFYRDTWFDYRQGSDFANSGNFYFNLYQQDSVAGSMQHVVINTEAASSNGIEYGESYIRTSFNILGFGNWWMTDYENSANSSFIKTVNNSDFNNAASFKGSFNLTDPDNRVSYSKTLEFDFTLNTWVEGSGIRLSIIN